jgi:hypothetical protein
MYNLRVYIKGPGVIKIKEPESKVTVKDANGNKIKKVIPARTKIYNTLSYRNVAKRDIQSLLNRVNTRDIEIIKHEIRLEK